MGERANSQVPAYLQHADVLVVPHLVNEFTDSLDPIKLYEYRAVGRPIVSTPVSGFRDCDRSEVVVADASRFPAALAAQLDAHRVADGPAYLAEDVPEWSERVSEMADAIESVAASRQR